MLSQNRATIILLDEPTSHIDGKSQEKVLNSLFRLANERNQTVLMIAHRLETAVTYCDSIMVLEEGMLKQFDKPLRLLVNEVTDDCITQKGSLFADMVTALSLKQQDNILKICKNKYF